MKIYAYPADEQGCGLHRIIWPALTLRGRGHDVVIVSPKARSNFLQGHLNTAGQLVDVTIPSDADVIVMQRITHRHLADAIPIMRKRGVAVVIDMDDDLASIDPRNPAFTAMHPKSGKHPDHSWLFAQRACDNATLVTVSTPSLLRRYARHGRGHVLFNCIPQRYLAMPHDDTSAVIGWGGSVHSHPDDLQTVGPAVSVVCRELGQQFKMIGPGEGVREALNLEQDPDATGPLDPQTEWPAGMNSLGIGIAPLADTIFNESKSWLKPLEYAALGVPCVMSPSAEYTRLHKRGVGYSLPRKPRQWLSALRELTASQSLREEVAGRGRDVAAELTVEKNAPAWLEAWERAAELNELEHAGTK